MRKGLGVRMKRFTKKSALAYLVITGTGFFLLNLLKIMTMRQLYWFDYVGVLLICMFAFMLWVNYYSKELVKINKLVDEFAAENHVNIVAVNDYDDEIDQLTKSLQMLMNNAHTKLKEMLQERDQMKTILASMVEGVLAFDTTGRLMLINESAEEMLNVQWEKVQEHYFLELLPNYKLAYLLNKCLDSGERQITEVKLSSIENEYYRIYITPIKGNDQNIQGVVMVLRNITRIRQLNQMRSEFIANVSHELRTPLTSIKGYVETLLDGAIENKELANKFLSIINTETNRLNNLISDLLFLSQLESGEMKVIKQDIDSSALLEKVISLLEPMAVKKNIQIKGMVSPGAETFRACQDMIEQVLINLLDNAIKYSHENKTVNVVLEPWVEDKADFGEEELAIKVIDQGIGIPSEHLSRLFERFYRVDKARSRQVGGTGLGLSIVKHIVERHRGRVQVSSSEKEGTVFTVIIPKY